MVEAACTSETLANFLQYYAVSYPRKYLTVSINASIKSKNLIFNEVHKAFCQFLNSVTLDLLFMFLHPKKLGVNLDVIMKHFFRMFTVSYHICRTLATSVTTPTPLCSGTFKILSSSVAINLTSGYTCVYLHTIR